MERQINNKKRKDDKKSWMRKKERADGIDEKR